MRDPRLIYAAVLAVMSLLTFALYAWDKRQATLGRWRTRERTLHLCALLGGWPGGLLGRRLFAHKTSKLGFSVILWTIAAAHLAAFALLIWRPTP